MTNLQTIQDQLNASAWESDRPTLPPAPAELDAVARYEAALADCGGVSILALLRSESALAAVVRAA